MLLPTWDGFQGSEPQSGLALWIRGFPYHSSTTIRPTPRRPQDRAAGSGGRVGAGLQGSGRVRLRGADAPFQPQPQRSSWI